MATAASRSTATAPSPVQKGLNDEVNGHDHRHQAHVDVGVHHRRHDVEAEEDEGQHGGPLVQFDLGEGRPARRAGPGRRQQAEHRGHGEQDQRRRRRWPGSCTRRPRSWWWRWRRASPHLPIHPDRCGRPRVGRHARPRTDGHHVPVRMDESGRHPVFDQVAGGVLAPHHRRRRPAVGLDAGGADRGRPGPTWTGRPAPVQGSTMWWTVRPSRAQVRAVVPEVARPPDRRTTTSSASVGAVGAAVGDADTPALRRCGTGDGHVAPEVHQDAAVEGVGDPGGADGRRRRPCRSSRGRRGHRRAPSRCATPGRARSATSPGQVWAGPSGRRSRRRATAKSRS